MKHNERFKGPRVQLLDKKSYHLHQFVEHHHEPPPQQPQRTPPQPQQQPPPPPPQQQRILVPQVPQPAPLYAGRPIHPRSYPVYSNGLIGNISREGSLSSDSGEGSGPISPVVNMKCEICGLSFNNSKSLQQVLEQNLRSGLDDILIFPFLF